MHVILHGLPRGFLRRLEQRPDIHVPAKVRKPRRNNLLAPVVPVLTHLGDQDTRATAFRFLEGVGQRTGGNDLV